MAKIALYIFIIVTMIGLSLTADILGMNQSISYGETLVSSDLIFELGLFTRGNSSMSYLGIWYKFSPETVVWVANRNNPLAERSGVLTFSTVGNLVLLNQSNGVVWSSKSSRVLQNPVVQLLDSGNLVIWDKFSSSSNEAYSWQSFDYPSDTLLAGMKLGLNLKTGFEWRLTAWKSMDDPSPGDYVFVTDRSRSAMSKLMHEFPSDSCNLYDRCGANAICSLGLCECVKGFMPRSPDEWKVLEFSSGCMRTIPTNCSKGEGFMEIKRVKLPDLLDVTLNKNMSLKKCKDECLKNCSCMAYANSDIRDGGSGCLMWLGDLIDMRVFEKQNYGQTLYIRLSASELDAIRDRTRRKIILVAVISSSIIGGLLSVVTVLWCVKHRKRRIRIGGKSSDRTSSSSQETIKEFKARPRRVQE
ncbi:G-type lectin S-receptor-like serine/threonine-protein kinase At4g27290 [Eucalyptus grandis]|uniref:G-type lectin S-receptor-like serine/threonine-protein kinase At4g27290 n=1 Tax=Eucalyptus grandis TaxID=71139 RepID=UPI00192EB84B|nr:G-type lectin S-receptor-like serine/threonine-protein kinase At4g27290 [Eucalyptus grandis]